jgi:predicted extracellular nuclease
MNNKRTQITRLASGLLALALVLTLVPMAGGPVRAAPMTQSGVLDVVINEVDSDTPSYDELEFIELYDGGEGNTALDGLVVVLFNGSSDLAYGAFDLDGFATDADGYFVIGSVAGADIYVDPGSSGWLQNGADAVALYSGDAAGFPNDTPVTTDNLLDALVYDTNDADDAGLLVLLNEGQLQINEDGLGDKDNHSNQRCPNGEGGARNTDTYTQFTATPRATNCELPPEACGDPFTPIYAIQGTGLASLLDGQEVATEGIVVGDFQVGGKNGFFIQDEQGDGDAVTSDGIFVYSTSLDVNVGDKVRVRGYVDEYYDLTEITSVSQVWSCGTGAVAPTEVYLPVSDLSQWEPYEGMLVTFPQALYISEYFDFDRYGEIVLTSARQNQPTAVVEPGPDAVALATENLLDRITLDDGRTTQNPDPAIHPNGGIFNLDNLFRGGDTVQNVTGALDYNFGLYKIQPTQGADYVSANPRTEQPDDVGGNLKVASFNVLNYFTTIDTGTWICGPSGDMECRGADTPEEFARQRDKIIAALVAIDADVVGLIEIENYPGDVPTADLVAGLNDVLGAGTYDYIATGAIGTDAIRQAIIYQSATVTPLGDYAILDSTVDARFLDDYNRPVPAQTFMDNATGGIFTVAVNHLKSKGSDCNAIGDPDTGDGSGNCNLTRMAAAEALVDWLAGDPTDSGDSDFLIIGDLNSYDKEDPIDVLLAGGYADLVSQYQGEYAYSYVFDGQLGYLDHALANSDLLGEVTGVTVWHINADEPDLIDYDMTFKEDAQDALYAPDAYRSSDHDPVIVGLNVCDEIAPTFDEVSVTPDMLWPPNHKYVTVSAVVTVADNIDPNPTLTLVSVTSNEPDDGLGDGDTPDDIVVVDDFTFELRAERSGTGDGRVYTITYEATDACGNSTIATATVTVPHSKGKGGK